MLESTAQSSFIDRMVGAARLDPQMYEEVEHDESATRQAMFVVVLGSLASGIGLLNGGLGGFAIGAVFAVASWAAYAFIAYWVGTHIFKGPQTSATWGELLRTLGFASSPRLLFVLMVIPKVGLFIAFGVFVWTLFTTVIAIRQALDFDTGRAVATAIVSLIGLVVVSSIAIGLVGSA
ncbi:MAG: YIP1 family protein [Chloroflexi bacterium]|nr:YIP1 family protein [Chloroflexota bacterium]